MARLRKDVHSSTHILLGGTQSVTILYCEKPGNESNSVPRRKRVWGFGEYEVGKLHYSLGCSALNYVPAKQRGGVRHHVSETSLSCTRVTMDINISPSCSSSSPSVRSLSKKCRQTGGLQNILPTSVAFSPHRNLRCSLQLQAAQGSSLPPVLFFLAVLESQFTNPASHLSTKSLLSESLIS